MKAIDLTSLNKQIADLVRELGFVHNHALAAAGESTSWPAQIAEDLNDAADAAGRVREYAGWLEHFVAAAASAATCAAKAAKTKKQRACRKCGCTHTTPCVDQRTGATCHWVAKDRCSACAKTKKPLRLRTERKGRK